MGGLFSKLPDPGAEMRLVAKVDPIVAKSHKPIFDEQKAVRTNIMGKEEAAPAPATASLNAPAPKKNEPAKSSLSSKTLLGE